MNIYYVYAYLRSKDSRTAKAGTPYYIGKGCNKRAWEKHAGVAVPVDKSNILLLEQNLAEIGSFAIERRMVQWYGRKDLGTGILHNRTDGGDGASGRIPWNKGKAWSDDVKAKLRIANLGKKHTEETKAKISMHVITEETRQKQKACVRAAHSEETKAKMRKPRSEETKLKMRKPKVKIECPHCEMPIAPHSKKWHFDNCKHRSTI